MEITDRKPQNVLFMNYSLLKHLPSSMAQGFMISTELGLNLSYFDAFPLQCHSDYLSSFLLP